MEAEMAGGYVRPRPLEFSMLCDVTPIGPTLGFYGDVAIPEWVADRFGRRFSYAGIAPRCLNGQFDVQALHSGEFVVRPGLVYRMEAATTFQDWARRMRANCKLSGPQ